MLDKGSANAVPVLKNSLTLVRAQDALAKEAFVERLLESNLPVIYLDIDLLYSGYARSGIAPQNINVRLRRIYQGNLTDEIVKTARMISDSRCLVIVDSLNGLYGMQGAAYDAMLSSYIMILAEVATYSDSKIVCTCIAEEGDDTILFPLAIPLIWQGPFDIISVKREAGIITSDIQDVAPA